MVVDKQNGILCGHTRRRSISDVIEPEGVPTTNDIDRYYVGSVIKLLLQAEQLIIWK